MRYLAVHEENKKIPLPPAHSRAEKYFHDISHHSLVRKCIPNLEELNENLKAYNNMKSICNVDKIKNSSRKLLSNLEKYLSVLNTNYKNIEWQIGKNEKGHFIHMKYKFKNTENALSAVHLLNEIQEASNHHSTFAMENFTTLKIELCTHQPKYGVTEMDLAFAEILSSKISAL